MLTNGRLTRKECLTGAEGNGPESREQATCGKKLEERPLEQGGQMERREKRGGGGKKERDDHVLHRAGSPLGFQHSERRVDEYAIASFSHLSDHSPRGTGRVIGKKRKGCEGIPVKDGGGKLDQKKHENKLKG